MREIFFRRVSNSDSANRKSKGQKRTRHRRWAAIITIASLFTAWTAAQAQQPKKLPRIGYLAAPDAATEAARADGFRQALRELGYVDGQTIAIEYRYTQGKPERAPDAAAEFVRLKVDIIVVAGGDPWIRGTQNTTKTIPIVMTGRGTDPVKAGFVTTLARPGGNVTGLTTLITELAGKRLELFKEAIPKVARVAFLYDPASPSNLNELKEAQSAASALKLTIHPWEARTVNDFDRVFTALNKDRPDGLYVAQGPLTRINVKRIAGFALKSKLPSLYTNTEAIDAGGLMYYGADLADTYRRIAYYVDKILKGAKPAELPVQQPTKFELAFNLKTAKQIGVTIPQSLLYRADKVIR